MSMRFSVAATLLLLLVGRVASAQDADGKLGARCSSDSECGLPGSFCWREASLDFTESGPAGGLCTALCAVAEECVAYQDGAECVPVCEGELCVGLCFEACQMGRAFGAELAGEKCHGREDLACIPVACADESCLATLDACAPLCTASEQCGAASECNLASGFCQSQPVEPGLPPGSPCELGLPGCSGLCAIDEVELWTHDVIVGICIEPCVVGAPGACGAQSGETPSRACIGRYNVWGGSLGDLGSCVALCNCTSECGAGEVCDPVDLGDGYDARGVCTRGPELEGASDCLDGVSGTAGSAGEAGAPGGCNPGELRACKRDGCLGTAECLPNGDYGECRCLEPLTMGEGGAPSEPDASADDADGGAGCGCRMAGGSAPRTGAWLLLLGLAACYRRRRRVRSAAAAHGE